MLPTVAVVVVNWNGIGYLDPCLDSIRSQTWSPIQTVVVDNASTDGSVDFIKARYPGTRLIHNTKNLGYAAACNLAFQFTQAPYVALVNNDIRLDARWVEELVTALEARASAACAGGRIYSLLESSKLLWTTPKLDHRTAKAIWVNTEMPPCNVDWVHGCGLIVKRAVADKIGLMDEAYFAYYEETDWCARMIRAGYDLLHVPSAVMWHLEMGSSDSSFNYEMMNRNRLRFALKNFDRSYLPIFGGLYLGDVIREVLANAGRGNWSKNRSLVRALAWNLAALPKTLAARRRDFRAIGLARSLNRSLPLRGYRSDGAGGLLAD